MFASVDDRRDELEAAGIAIVRGLRDLLGDNRSCAMRLSSC